MSQQTNFAEFIRKETYARFLCALVNEGLLEFSQNKLSDDKILYSNNQVGDVSFTVHGRTPFGPLFKEDITAIVCLRFYPALLSKNVASGQWTEDNWALILYKLQNSVENFEHILHNKVFADKDVLGEWKACKDSISFEAFVFGGHSFHPFHKMRYPVGDVDLLPDYYEYERGTPIELCVIETPVAMEVFGKWHEWCENALKIKNVPSKNSNVCIVHPMQLRVLRSLNIDFSVLTTAKIAAIPQCSIRTMTLVGGGGDTQMCDIKLSIALQTTSSIRGVSRFAIHNGVALRPWLQRVSNETVLFLQKISSFGSIFDFQYEVASCGLSHEHFGNGSKMLGCIIREHGIALKSDVNVRQIPVTFLMDKSPFVHELNICRYAAQSGNEISFYEAFIKTFIETFVYVLVRWQCALECHCQNTYLVVSVDAFNVPVEILGFVYKDFGGIKVFHDQIAPFVLAESPILSQNKHEIVDCFMHDFLQLLLILYKNEILQKLSPSFVKSAIQSVIHQLNLEPEADGEILQIFTAKVSEPTYQSKQFLKMELGKSEKKDFYGPLSNFLFESAKAAASNDVIVDE